MEKNNTYILETLPTEINHNQFYCFNESNGKIMIGNIIGKSALKDQQLYEVDNVTYLVPDYLALDESIQTTKLRDGTQCFLYYQDFLKEYTEYRCNKKAKTTSLKVKYIVDKRTLQAEATKAKETLSIYKAFDTKKEAKAYVDKRLPLRIKVIENAVKELKDIKEKIEKYKPTTSKTKLDEFRVMPSILKENDLLTKYAVKTLTNSTSGWYVKEDFMVSVKGFIKPEIAKLSDGTLLIENECKCYRENTFIKYDAIDKVKKVLKNVNSIYLANNVNGLLSGMENTLKFYKDYTPFETPFKYITITMTGKQIKQQIEDYKNTLKYIK